MDLLEKMGTFVRVIEAGSFSAAARQLRLSAPAVGRQIATLESELRVVLLTRTTRRMALTAAGRRYYERCLRVLREVDEAQSVGRGDATEGPLQVSAPVTFGLERVVPHMQALMAKHPGMRVDLRLDDRRVDLALEGVDVAIRVGSEPPESTDLVAHRLTSFRRVVVASPAYLKRKGEPKAPVGLARHDALVSTAPGDSWTLTNAEEEVRVRLNVVFRSNSMLALCEIAVAGIGVTMLPEWFVTDARRRRGLRVLLAGWQSEPVVVNALYRVAHRGSPRVRALIEHLRGVYAS